MAGCPPLTVLMTTRNVPARHLVPAVESLFAQSEADFELLINDGGSTDATPRTLKRLEGRDPRLRVVLGKPQNMYASLNEILKQARGEFVALMDSDDLCRPDRFAQQLAFLRANPEIVCVGTDAVVVDPEGEPLARLRQPTTHEEIDGAALRGLGGTIVHASAMVRRAAFLQVDGYDDRFTHHGDFDLFLRLAEVGRLANLPEPLYLYRQHLRSITHSQRPEKDEMKQEIVAAARRRRGLPEATALMPTSALLPPGYHYLRWARLAWMSGSHRTAGRYFAQALCRLPLEAPTWRRQIGYYLARATKGKEADAALAPRSPFVPYRRDAAASCSGR